MSSDCVSSETEGHPASGVSPVDSSWLSDSDGRRSVRDVPDVDESPWWESEVELEKQPWQQVCNNSPNLFPSPSEEDSSASSFTPTWWSEPSSRQFSTSATEIEVDPGRDRSNLKSSSRTGSEAEGVCDKEEIKPSMVLKNRKRSREQSNVASVIQKEPPLRKPKLEPPSPHSDPNSTLQDLKKGISKPLESFFLFFTVDLLTKICDLTNVEGWERILEEPSLASKDGSWEELTVKEMYAFLAVVLIMRRNWDVCFGAFWREPFDQKSHWPRDLMKRSRFFTLLQVLRVTDQVKQDMADEKPNRLNRSEAQTEQPRPAFSEDGSATLKEMKYVFDQMQRIFKVFFAQFEFQCLEEISVRDGLVFQGEMHNYMKILPLSCETSPDGVKFQSRKPSEEVDGMNSPKLTSDETACNGTLTAPKSEHLSQVVESNRTEPKSASGYHASKSKAENCEQGEKVSGNALSDSQELFSVESADKCDLKRTSTNAIGVRWQDASLTVTSADTTPSKLPSVEAMSKEVKMIPQSWQEVFVPCPELVYKDCFTRAFGTNSTECSRSDGLRKSFLYHYLHLAVYFSTSKDIRRLLSGSEGTQSESDSLEQITEGLVLLGKPDSVSQLDSETDTSEEGAGRDSTSTDQSDSDTQEDSDERQKPHKYVQARSRVSHKCALCWSLHHESRRVHTRCVRCGWHLCLSRFRNCMEEAHQDQEIMSQLWDKGTDDVQSTSEAIN